MEEVADYIVYVKTDELGNVTEINSSAFLSDITGWKPIDQGNGDKYHHAQGNYLGESIKNNDDCYNYKYANGVISLRTSEEKQADILSRPDSELTLSEQIEVLTQNKLTLEKMILELKVRLDKIDNVLDV